MFDRPIGLQGMRGNGALDDAAQAFGAAVGAVVVAACGVRF